MSKRESLSHANDHKFRCAKNRHKIDSLVIICKWSHSWFVYVQNWWRCCWWRCLLTMKTQSWWSWEPQQLSKVWLISYKWNNIIIYDYFSSGKKFILFVAHITMPRYCRCYDRLLRDNGDGYITHVFNLVCAFNFNLCKLIDCCFASRNKCTKCSERDGAPHNRWDWKR